MRQNYSKQMAKNNLQLMGSIYVAYPAHRLNKLHMNFDVATALMIVVGSSHLTDKQKLTSLKQLFGEDLLKKIWGKNIHYIVDGSNPPYLESNGKL
jgi:hypothetical protein